MVLTKIRVRNFRLLENFGMALRDDVTILIGANNTGKSNVIDAFLIISDALRARSFQHALSERHGLDRVVSRHDMDREMVLQFEFLDDTKEVGRYKVAVGPGGIYLNEDAVIPGDAPARVEGLLGNEPLNPWPQLANFFRGIVHIDPFRQVAFQWAVGASEMVQATGSDLARVLHYHYNNDRERFDAYEETVKRVLPEVEIIETPILGEQQTTVTIRFTDTPEKYDLWQLSSGVKDVLVLLAAIHFSPEASLLLIEEPENHLHPTAQKALAAVIRDAALNEAKQTIVTTHAEYLLEQFEPEQVFFVDRREGTAQAVRLDQAEVFEVWERLGIERSRLLEALGRGKQAIIVIEGRDDLKALEPVWEAYDLAENVLPARAAGGGWRSIIDGAKALREALDRFHLSSSVFVLLDNDGKREEKEAYLEQAGFGDASHVWSEKELESYLLIPQALASISGRDEGSVTQVIDAAESQGKEKLERVLTDLGIPDVGLGTIVTNAVRAGDEYVPEEFVTVVGKVRGLLGMGG